jgi:hypothetical protein
VEGRVLSTPLGGALAEETITPEEWVIDDTGFNENDGAHVEQKNGHVVRYHGYDTAGELELLNRICELQRLLTKHFGPQQKLVSKERNVVKVIKIYDAALTPHQRAVRDPNVRKGPVSAMNAQFRRLNPAALFHPILSLTGELEAFARARAPLRDHKTNTTFNPGPKRTFSHEATKQPSRTH